MRYSFYFILNLLLLSLSVLHANTANTANTKVQPFTHKADRKTRVTVYRDAALVTEKLFVPIVSGKQQYAIDGLPTTIVPDSIMLYIKNHNGEIFIQDFYLKNNQEGNKSTLVLSMDSKISSLSKSLVLNYVCSGICWKAFHTFKLSPKYETITINSWIVVKNETGVGFKKAKVFFIDKTAPGLTSKDHEKTSSSDQTIKSYNFNGQVDIPRGVKLLNWTSSCDKIPVTQEMCITLNEKYLKYLNSKTLKPDVETWISANMTDISLPGGGTTLYYQDEQGTLEFLGKMTLGAFENGDEMSLRVPQTHSDKDYYPEISSVRSAKQIDTALNQIEFKKLSDDISEANYRLTLTNNSDQPLKVRVQLNIPSSCKEWLIVRENVIHQESGTNKPFWYITLDPKKEQELVFRLRIVWLEPMNKPFVH